MSSETSTPNLILKSGLFTTLNPSRPTANAVAIKDGKFLAVGRDEDVMRLAEVETTVIDLEGRRALPGLIDNHLHASAWSSKLPISDLKSFWGALGCACWAV